MNAKRLLLIGAVYCEHAAHVANGAKSQSNKARVSEWLWLTESR
jgi:hypothetical protein